MKIKSLYVKGLFGYFNHTIHFIRDDVTIITAPNGYGKTVCLKIIESIFKMKFHYFETLQFQEISLTTNKATLLITKSKDEKVSFKATGQKKYNYQGLSRSQTMSSKASLERFIPFISRIDFSVWEDSIQGDNISYEDVLRRYPEYLPAKFTSDTYPEWLEEFCSSIKVHFILDQRLFVRTPNLAKHSRHQSNQETIIKYAAELAQKIKDVGQESSSISQGLDSTFPSRLLRRKSDIYSVEVIKNELTQIQKRREELSSYNLIYSSDQLPQLNLLDEIKDGDAKVLTLYIEDTKEKLDKYNDIYNKINLFSTLLNNKNLTHKKVTFSQDDGFSFSREINNQGDKPLSLKQLSSGEQHQIVLLFEMIFKSDKNTLVLIDEPEISLHVAWQKEFLEDLRKTIALQNMSVVIATHSPTIVGGNWDLVTDLEESSEVC